jgi:cytochrome c oxidase cbb3-type subunit III
MGPRYLVDRLLACSALAVFVVLAGCNSAPASIASAGASATSTPVGPVPGSADATKYNENPLATDPVALQDGRRLFDWYNCSGCHGGHAGGGMGPSLRDEVWIYGSRADQVFDSIAQGRANGMPAWGSKIPQIQLWELVAYIKSMRTTQEPDPPIEPADEMVPDPEDTTNPAHGMQSRASQDETSKKQGQE